MAEPAKPKAEIEIRTAAVQGDDVHELREWVSRYGPAAGLGLAIALIGIFGFGTFRNHNQAQKEGAALAWSMATTPAEFQDVVSQFKNTPTAPAAMLGLASSYFKTGEYELAKNAYHDFETTFAEHPMAKAARLCQAQCMEAAGNLEDALHACAELGKQLPEDHYLQPQIDLERGRCLEQLHRWDEAKAVYEDFLAKYPDTPWIDQAEIALRTAKKAARVGSTP